MNLESYIEKRLSEQRLYSTSAIITRDGNFHEVRYGHTNKMMELFCIKESITEEEVWELMPVEAAPIIWFMEKLCCLVVSWDVTLYMDTLNEAQKTSYTKLVDSRMIYDCKKRLRRGGW